MSPRSRNKTLNIAQSFLGTTTKISFLLYSKRGGVSLPDNCSIVFESQEDSLLRTIFIFNAKLGVILTIFRRICSNEKKKGR